MADEQPKIHIDSDWKAQAQAEKKRLAEQEKARATEQAAPSTATAGPAGAGAGAAQAGRQIPPASMETLISTLASQAMLSMGLIGDPRMGNRYQNLDLARHHIDLLSVLEEKTAGNLTEDETKMLASVLYELRSHYVQACNAARAK